MNKEKIAVGLIKGRHDMPVDDYIFEKIEDVHDFDSIWRHISVWLDENVGVEIKAGQGTNQLSSDDVAIYRGKKALVVYVTGLTSVTACLITLCATNGIPLSLMHYDRDSASYKEQVLFV